MLHHNNSNNHQSKSDIVTATISPREDEAGKHSRLAPLNLYSAIASIEIDNKSSVAPTSTVSQIQISKNSQKREELEKLIETAKK